MVDSERRRVGWQGQRRKETYSLTQAESRVVSHGTQQVDHVPFPATTLSASTPGMTVHLFFCQVQHKGWETGFLCLALVWLGVFCHPHGSKAISNFGKLLKIYPSGFLENLEIWMFFRGRMLMILYLCPSFMVEVSSSVDLRLKSSLICKMQLMPPNNIYFSTQNFFLLG